MRDKRGLDFERQSIKDDVYDIGGHRLEDFLAAVGHYMKVVNNNTTTMIIS